MKQPVAIVTTASLLSAILVLLGVRWSGNRAVAQAPASPQASRNDAPAQVVALQERVKSLQDLVPDQAAVMTHVGYHFANLWFAIDRENWPLADFYLGETRNNVKWAVRAKPIRKNSEGQEIDLGGIAEAVDRGVFTDMKRAIDARDKATCIKVYDDTLANCYACHKASSKPYLRPRRPERPEAPVINFDPGATSPQ